MIKALVYAHIPCPACGDALAPLMCWIVESGYTEDGHACELEVDLIKCHRCGVLTDGLCELGALEAIDAEVLDAFYDGRTYPVGEILGYYRRESE